MAPDVLVVGAGVSGLSAGIFTARAGLETVLVDGGDPILSRNAHLENYPGFPAGVDARRFLRMVRDQAATAGCSFVEGRVTDLAVDGGRFTARVSEADSADVESGENGEGGSVRTIDADRVVAASWSDVDYLSRLDVELAERGSKQFVEVDDGGRTGVDGLYAAGRIAGEPHQTVVSAGHGAKVGLAVIHDSETPFYHDWVTPEGYFTGRGREVPPACEEIDNEERLRRERRSREVLREHLEAAPTDPVPHPSLEEE